MSDLFRKISSEEASARIGFLLGPDVDCCEVSLIDSTCGSRINCPGRGILCDHIDVVDVLTSVDQTDLQSDGMTLNPAWMCPVCGKEYTNLDCIEIDGFFLNILSEIPVAQTSIIIFADGRYTSPVTQPISSTFQPHKRKERIFADLPEVDIIDCDSSPLSKKQNVISLSSSDSDN